MLYHFCQALIKQRKYARAAILFGAVERALETVSLPDSAPGVDRDYLSEMKRWLGFRFSRRWNAGRKLSLIEAMALATLPPEKSPFGRWFAPSKSGFVKSARRP